MKTPFRYPGGKSRALKYILPLIPDIKELVSPFIGGGAVEIALANKGVRVYGYDKNKYIVKLWQQILGDNMSQVLEVIADGADWVKNIKDYNKMTEMIEASDNDIEVAGWMWLSVSMGFSGIPMNTGITSANARIPEQLKKRSQKLLGFNYLRELLTVEYGDFADSIPRHPAAFMYADPPYCLAKTHNILYGKKGDLHKTFNHERLREVIGDCKEMVLSYNDCDHIRQLYSDYNIQTAEWYYSSGDKSSNGRELLICGGDVRVENQPSLL